jgi:hypothetical protein
MKQQSPDTAVVEEQPALLVPSEADPYSDSMTNNIKTI